MSGKAVAAGALFITMFFVLSSPAFSAEYSPRLVTYTGASASATSTGHTSLRSVWSASNQFGSAHTWYTHTSSRTRVFHLSFVGKNGDTLEETIAPGRVALVSSVGSRVVRKLPNGYVTDQIFVTSGACHKEHANTVPMSASITVDDQGALVGFPRNSKFRAVQHAFACGTAPVISDLRSFMAQAGLALPVSGASFIPPLTSANTAGRVYANISGGCAWAIADLAIATAALAAAMAGEVPSGGLDTPAVLLAWAGYVSASLHYEHECAGTI